MSAGPGPRRRLETALVSGLARLPAGVQRLLASGRPVRLDGLELAADVQLVLFFLWHHSGGWAVGSIETHDPVCRFVSRATDAAVLAVDYHLAPEHPFPAAVDDALATFRCAKPTAGRRSAP